MGQDLTTNNNSFPLKKNNNRLKIENKGHNLLPCEDIELVVLFELYNWFF